MKKVLFMLAVILTLPIVLYATASARGRACTSNNDCKSGEFCDFPAGECGAVVGECKSTEGILCPAEFDPVCGCDGNTYSNDCVRRLAGVQLDHSGLCVVIDIKPGSDPNSINLQSEGVIPVAILTTDSFDASTVDPNTVLFGATGTEATPVQSALKDVDGDGDTDMILRFNTWDTGIVCGDTSASLTGVTLGGQMIEASDSINTVGCM